MHQDSRIYVAGHRGLVGSALMRALVRRDCSHLITRTHADLDLTHPAEVERFFAHERPEYVFLAAGPPGDGSGSCPRACAQQHLAIQTNVIYQAWRTGVQRLLFMGSSSLYPADCPQPIQEACLRAGPDPDSAGPAQADAPCAQAKRSGIEMCWSYNRQFGTRYLAAMPCTLYGPGDLYGDGELHGDGDLHGNGSLYAAGHAPLVPALIHALHQAKVHGGSRVALPGSRTARREFLFSDDLAEACVRLMAMTEEQYQHHVSPEAPPLFNIGSGCTLSLGTLAEAVSKVVGFQGELAWDTDQPGAASGKLLDASRVRALGWSPSTPLEAGVRQAYAAYLRQVVGE